MHACARARVYVYVRVLVLFIGPRDARARARVHVCTRVTTGSGFLFVGLSKRLYMLTFVNMHMYMLNNVLQFKFVYVGEFEQLQLYSTREQSVDLMIE